jgi:hypothetical protein
VLARPSRRIAGPLPLHHRSCPLKVALGRRDRDWVTPAGNIDLPAQDIGAVRQLVSEDTSESDVACRHPRLDRIVPELVAGVADDSAPCASLTTSRGFKIADIDDIGLLPVPSDTAEALYRVVDAAYEQRSLALSSNLHPSGFDELMPKTIANATVDTLLHHAQVVLTGGDSIRLTQATRGKGVKPVAE